MNYMKKSSLPRIIKSNRQLLDDFCIDCNRNVVDHISELYPDELAIDRYIRGLIKEKLNR